MVDKVLIGKLAESLVKAMHAANRAEAHVKMCEETLLDALRDGNEGKIPTGAIVTPSGEVLMVCEGIEDDELSMVPFVVREDRIA